MELIVTSCSKCEFSWFNIISFFIVQWIGAYFHLFLIWLILVNFEVAFWKIIHQKCLFVWSLARLGPARPIFLRKIPSTKWNSGLSVTSKILILSIFGFSDYHDIRCRWYWQIWQLRVGLPSFRLSVPWLPFWCFRSFVACRHSFVYSRLWCLISLGKQWINYMKFGYVLNVSCL